MVSLNPILSTLIDRFSDHVSDPVEAYGLPTLTVKKEQLLAIFNYLYTTEGYQFLTTLCGIHLINEIPQKLGVVYHLHNLQAGSRLRLKTFTPLEDPTFPTLTGLFESANWMEREAYDFFGICFDGHPNLTRILNIDDMTVFPMRKDEFLEDATREDKNDSMFGR